MSLSHAYEPALYEWRYLLSGARTPCKPLTSQARRALTRHRFIPGPLGMLYFQTSSKK